MQAVFLDRDGVINVNRDNHVLCWEEFEFLPGALAALRRLHHAGVRCFVVTNQAAVGRGQLSATTLEAIHTRMRHEIQAHGGQITDVAYCPHPPRAGCDCRKPQPGMLRRLAAAHQIQLRGCYLVGDALSDLEAGQRVGCRTMLVLTGRGSAQVSSPAAAQGLQGSTVVPDLGAAVSHILAQRAAAPSYAERHEGMYFNAD